MSKLAKALTAAAGNAGGDNLYVEDVFSTYLYEGTSAAGNVVTNGIDLAGEGGLVWLKSRGDAQSHGLFDTERGAGKILQSNATAAELPYTDVSSFNSDGFTAGYYSGWFNSSNYDQCSWTFRKAEKFFDVVTWTGDGTGARTISHSLNGTVGALFMKATNASMQWFSYHNGLTNQQFLELNATTTAVSSANAWNNTTPTSSEFTVGSYGNISGRTYVAYLFASDAGGFGDDGSESIIKCGSYTGNGSTTGPIINLGFEPQWVMIKNISFANDWWIFDSMRGIASGGADSSLRANISGTENTGTNALKVTATGFQLENGGGDYNGSTQQYIYIAIRRPMKTPESGTEVFNTIERTGTGADATVTGVGFTPDALLGMAATVTSGDRLINDRMRGVGQQLLLNTTAAEAAAAAGYDYTSMDMDGFKVGLDQYGKVNYSPASIVNYCFKRATGFFDVVAYTGDGTAGRQIPHNLGAVPQLMITKARNSVELWRIGYTADQIFTNWGSTGYTWINNGNIYGDGTQWIDPTASYVTMQMNTSGRDYIQYLFGTLAGVSKVGSYTGNGTTQNIECGFSGGARFVMLWNRTNPTLTYVWDSERGIITGSPDPRLAINSTAAEVTTNDALNTYAGGFGVTSSTVANRNGDTYIFLAIA